MWITWLHHCPLCLKSSQSNYFSIHLFCRARSCECSKLYIYHPRGSTSYVTQKQCLWIIKQDFVVSKQRNVYLAFLELWKNNGYSILSHPLMEEVWSLRCVVLQCEEKVVLKKIISGHPEGSIVYVQITFISSPLPPSKAVLEIFKFYINCTHLIFYIFILYALLHSNLSTVL